MDPGSTPLTVLHALRTPHMGCGGRLTHKTEILLPQARLTACVHTSSTRCRSADSSLAVADEQRVTSGGGQEKQPHTLPSHTQLPKTQLPHTQPKPLGCEFILRRSHHRPEGMGSDGIASDYPSSTASMLAARDAPSRLDWFSL